MLGWLCAAGMSSNRRCCGARWFYGSLIVGQTDMCVFGDGSMASAWSLAFIGWASESGTKGDGFLAIREKVSDAQVFLGVHVPGNIFKD